MAYVSVVIPVHNGEQHLRETLDSVRAQTLSDFEVICVDDGSTDSTPQILADYCASDQRFSFISIPNSGAGPSRNLGMEKANGKYLYVLDADDLLVPHALATAVRAADDFDADVVLFKYQRFNSATGRVTKTVRPNELPTMTLDRAVDKSQESYIFELSSPAPWNKLYSRQFIVDLGIKFQDLPRVNDLFFGWSAIAAATRIVLLDEVLIHYRSFQLDSLSLRQTQTPLAITDALFAAHNFLLERGLYSKELERSFVNEAVSNYSVNLANIENETPYEKLFKVGQEQLFPKLKVFEFPPEYFMLPETALFVDHMRQIKNHRDFAFTRVKSIHGDCAQLMLEIAGIQKELIQLDSQLAKLWRSLSFIIERGPKAFARKLKASLRGQSKKSSAPQLIDLELHDFHKILSDANSFSDFESQFNELREARLSELNISGRQSAEPKDDAFLEHVAKIRNSPPFDYLLFRQISGRINRRKLRRMKDNLSNAMNARRKQVVDSKTFQGWVKAGKAQIPQG